MVSESCPNLVMSIESSNVEQMTLLENIVKMTKTPK